MTRRKEKSAAFWQRFFKRICKPGSVIDSHLSRRTVTDTLKPPPRDGRAGHLSLHGVAPDRVYITKLSPAGACALTARFHPCSRSARAVSFCCTCPRVTPGGRYPLSLPYGARTFLMCGLSPCTRGRSVCSRGLFYPKRIIKSRSNLYSWHKSLIIKKL